MLWTIRSLMLSLVLVVSAANSLSISGQANSRPTPKAGNEYQVPTAHREHLLAKLQELAGSSATFCGYVPLGESSREANKCAQKAFNEGRPFYIGYDSGHTNHEKQWADWYWAVGVARNSTGQLWTVSFNSKCRTEPSLPGQEAYDANCIGVLPCPRPYQLIEGIDGGLVPLGWKTGPKRVSCTLFGR